MQHWPTGHTDVMDKWNYNHRWQFYKVYEASNGILNRTLLNGRDRALTYPTIIIKTSK